MDEKSNFTDLILLVGTNPLPNLVVSKYFLKKNKDLSNIWFIYSENNLSNKQKGTRELAENIKSILAKLTDKVEYHFVPLSDVSSSKCIADDISQKMFEKIADAENRSFHLNYTGGTKTMVVHTYNSLKTKDNLNLSFSYLSARDCKIKYDNGERDSEDLRYYVKLELEDLINLHGYKKKPEKSSTYPRDLFAGINNKIYELINDKGKINEYLEWQRNFLRPYYFSEKEFIKTKSNFLKKVKLEYLKKANQETDLKKVCNESILNDFKVLSKGFDPDILDLLNSFPDEYSLIDADKNLWVPGESDKNKKYVTRLKDTVNFLAGLWFEDYIFSVIQNNLNYNQSLCKQLSIEQNWKMEKISGSKDFELDIVVLLGYQVIGISVTTDYREDLCKNKGFELLYRVVQIGGDESKAVLITTLDEDKRYKVERDLKTISGTTDEKLLVIGVSKIVESQLWNELKGHIWG